MTSPNILFTINGNSHSVGSQTVNLTEDRGLAYGHGLFETILFSQSALPLIDRHLLRLIPDSHLLGISLQSGDVQHYLNLFLEALSDQSITDGVIKIMVTAGSGGRGYKMPDTIIPSLIFSYNPLPEDTAKHRKQGVDVRLCEHFIGNGSTLAGIKHLNRLDQVIARSEWSHNKYADGIMLSVNGDVVEATSANIFVKTKEGKWITPTLDQSGVSGVMRGLLIDRIFPACDLSVSETNLTLDELLMSQQILLCNSVKGILRVNSVSSATDKQLLALPSDHQGLMLCEKLMELYPHYQ